MPTLKQLAAEVSSTYQHQRYWFLHELRRLRASVRAGYTVNKERKLIQRKLAELRKNRSA